MTEFLNKEQMRERVWDILNLLTFNEATENRLNDLIDFISGEPIDINLTKSQASARVLDIAESLKIEFEAKGKLKAFLGHLREAI